MQRGGRRPRPAAPHRQDPLLSGDPRRPRHHSPPGCRRPAPPGGAVRLPRLVPAPPSPGPVSIGSDSHAFSEGFVVPTVTSGLRPTLTALDTPISLVERTLSAARVPA